MERCFPLSALPMPYGNGLTVAARNRGSEPIEGIGFSMSVDRASGDKAAEYASRMRLRGIYQPASAATEELINQRGAGRWVALVYEQPKEATTGIAALNVDGQDVDGWAMDDLDPLWGRPGEGENFYTALSGHRAQLGWRYLVLEPVSFGESLVLKPRGEKLGGRLALFYLQ